MINKQLITIDHQVLLLDALCQTRRAFCANRQRPIELRLSLNIFESKFANKF